MTDPVSSKPAAGIDWDKGVLSEGDLLALLYWTLSRAVDAVERRKNAEPLGPAALEEEEILVRMLRLAMQWEERFPIAVFTDPNTGNKTVVRALDRDAYVLACRLRDILRDVRKQPGTDAEAKLQRLWPAFLPDFGTRVMEDRLRQFIGNHPRLEGGPATVAKRIVAYCLDVSVSHQDHVFKLFTKLERDLIPGWNAQAVIQNSRPPELGRERTSMELLEFVLTHVMNGASKEVDETVAKWTRGGAARARAAGREVENVTVFSAAEMAAVKRALRDQKAWWSGRQLTR